MNKEQWLIFYSGDIKEIEAVEKIAEQVPQVELVVVAGSEKLSGRVIMPFIEDNEGNRCYGLPSIEKYVEKYIKRLSLLAG